MAKTQKKRSAPSGISFIQELGGIQEYKLDSNDLRILLIPDNSIPVAGFMVTYHVGSRNETIGYTGATHMLEHLLFKGTKKFNKAKGTQMEQLLEGKGAMINATTWFDRTNYYEVLPSSALPLSIEIEADRMRNALIQDADRQTEMPVVRNEFERGENLSMEALDKEVWAAAFLAHPYHHSTIGWKSDIERVPIERLQQFYNDFYWPNNATVTVVGDFDTPELLSLIQKHFGVHPRSPKPFPEMYTEEPPQQGQRRVLVHRTGTDIFNISYKIPPASHKDIPALVLLDMVMSDGKTSRLYKSLVDTGLSTGVSVYCYQLKDPGLFQTYVTIAPKKSHAEVEKIVVQEYQKVIKKGITATELAKVKRSYRSYEASRRDGAYALLSSLNEEIATGNWQRFVELPKAIEKVTASDIQRVAQTYCVENQSVVGYFINTNS